MRSGINAGEAFAADALYDAALDAMGGGWYETDAARLEVYDARYSARCDAYYLLTGEEVTERLVREAGQGMVGNLFAEAEA